MIAPLRRRHRLIVVSVGLVALAGFVAALAARPSRPITPAGSARPDTSTWAEFGPGAQLRAALDGDAGETRVHVARGPRLVAPDLLVYVASSSRAPVGASAEVGANGLPAGAVLLGALGDPGIHRYPLPAAAQAGELVIFSLGHGSVLATEPLGSLPRIE